MKKRHNFKLVMEHAVDESPKGRLKINDYIHL